MISINNLSYYIGGRALYENASMFVRPDDKIGLIGLNGRGKSTLLKLINGELTPDAGTISKSKNCTIGFLNQDQLSYQSSDSILTLAMGAFRKVVDMERQIEQLIHELENEYNEDKVNRLAQLQEKYDQAGGYALQSKAEEVLEGIGFSTHDLHRPLNEFSGGWRMRAMLARLLLERPSLLMLDEPTNHLDLPSIEWVENYLKNYEGAVIIVSHDRRFLDNITNKTVEVTRQQLITYEGNYSFYLEEKALREEIQQNAYENQQAKIRQAERFIERFRAKASKARQVKSKEKALERMERIEEVVNDVAEIRFRFQFNQQPGKTIVTLKNISKSYGSLSILHNTSAEIMRGDKIALIGANGRGKSTLLRILAGNETFDGQRIPGYNVITGFYAQHQIESLNLENEMLEELKQAGTGKTEQQLRNVLGCFLFSDEDHFKKIKVLSGGEKSRVALAKTLISEANFLLLDEPTNHLDFISENILIQALQQYEGTFVVVSHNRHFISQVANKIWYIEDHQIKEYPGTYEEYDYWLKNRKINEASSKTPEMVQPKSVKQTKRSATSVNLKHELSQTEARIEQLEKEKAALEDEMMKPEVYADFERLSTIQQRYNAAEEELKQLLVKWDNLISASM
ncbi:MAG: ABC-F family ATP-binding cassette domain-containing protein [Cyclobacteriaceae bacterium]|nr:ABC-F family ATP-binding cassette domain-containing protein [Cyclobacteriaceae bacterium]MCX7637243.1 ABC-F family ATP-binding cassette domain-containing protein [Cyclobacteriaceae bacterium]MDW8331945.1 ABC-F family ATP-binding cassette domain-containing protein [Cyclobacteriaceae bacterium]